MLPTSAMALFKNILVPTDCGPAARRAAEIACGIAAESGASITLLHVWTVPLPSYAQGLTFPLEEMEAAGRQALDAEAARVREKCPSVNVKTMLLPGLAFRAVLEAIQEHGFDVVVMGTHGRKGLEHLFLGSVAENVVRAAPVPVMTVHAPDDH